MSLTKSDLQEIRSIVEEVIQPAQNEIAALRNDVKEIYDMLSDLRKSSKDASFDKLSLEQKILDIHSKLLRAAKQAGVDLPG